MEKPIPIPLDDFISSVCNIQTNKQVQIGIYMKCWDLVQGLDKIEFEFACRNHQQQTIQLT